MNEKSLQSVANAVAEQIKSQQNVTLDTALKLAEKVKQKATIIGVKAREIFDAVA